MTGSMTQCALFAAIIAMSNFGGVGAQPANWPLLPKVLATPGKSTLRGSAQWTPASSVDGEQVVNSQIGKDFLVEVESALGHELPNGRQEHFAAIVEALRPTFQSLEKNEYGNLGHTAVRYSVHRLFVARHGWFIKGLDPEGQHFNSSSPVRVFEGKIPVYAQGLFEHRLGGKGFGLQELAVFAALLEDLIDREAVDRVDTLLKILSIPKNRPIPRQHVDVVLDGYLAIHILGTDLSNLRRKPLLQRIHLMPQIYTNWNETHEMLRQIRAEVIGSSSTSTLADIQNVVRMVGEKFGHQTNKDCQIQKDRLMDLEVGEKGCVPFFSFYKPMLASGGKDWQFAESPEYLTQLGIVDDSEPKNLKVMIPNYLNAPSNCIASSSYYHVCCIDECESLLGHIERHVQGPSATPSTLVQLVSHLPSSTERPMPKLSSLHIRRLHRIADNHDGQVPIHGRLFMQWMHHVYPRECAYPHRSGTTKSLSAQAWTDATGNDTTATLEQMKAMSMNAQTLKSSSSEGQCGQWREDEELFVSVPMHRRSLGELESDVQTWVATSSVALVCALAAMVLVVMSTVKSMAKSSASKRHRSFVLI